MKNTECRIAPLGNPKAASALITTLLVLVVLSTILVAFMQSMSTERSVAKSHANSYRSQLAAQAGMDAAMRQLSLAMGTNQAYLVGQTNDAGSLGPVLVVAPGDLTNTAALMPLISGDLASLNGYPTNSPAVVLAYLNARTNTNASASINLNIRNKLVQGTTDSGLYRAPWVYVTDTSGQTNARYAYILLDEWARVNPGQHRGQPRNNPTNWFPGPEVLPLFTGGTNLLSGAEATNSLVLDGWLMSPHTTAQAFASNTAYEAKKHLLSVDQTWGPDVIPAGLPGGGLPKYNINDLATNPVHGATAELRANNMAAIINSNLPLFKQRDPSLLSYPASDQERYLRRLTASIVDYIDSDSGITLVNGGEPAGRDLFPLVAAVPMRYRRTAYDTNSNPWTTTIESQSFVQVWNPYTTTITYNSTVRFVLKNRMKINFGTGIVTPFTNYDQSITTNVTIRPNEFVVLTFPTVSQTWTSPIGATTNITPRWTNSPQDASDSITHLPFEFYWGGSLVGMCRRNPVSPGNDIADANAGITRNSKNHTTTNNHWQAGFPQSVSGAGGWRFVGDPMGGYLSNYDWPSISSDDTYRTNTHWKGRQTTNLSSSRQQEYNITWATRDYVRANPVMGIVPGNINTTPAMVASPYVEATEAPKAVAVIRNAAMQSIGELGHIYDPAHADDSGAAPLGGTGANNSEFASAGGRTLRIGHPEQPFAFNPWATNGKRAIELLDLFTVNSTNANSTNFPVARGRININTAPQPVLEALFYDISPTSDAAFTNSVITGSEASTLAQLLMTNRPYHKLSDLYKITAGLADATNYTPPLSTNTAGKAAVFDRAREEAFGKMVGLATVQSRAFRIYVVAQALGPNLKQQAQAALEASLTIRTEPDGRLTPEIQYIRWEN